MPRLKRPIATNVLAIAFGVLGTASGLTLRSALATENEPGTEVFVGEDCGDECGDGGMSCVQAPGRNIRCSFTDRTSG